jgi:hypothetical protein
MFKQSIARVFCIITVFLLSSNVVLSSVPFQKVVGKTFTTRNQTISSLVDSELDSTYILEQEDPLEDLDFLATIPSFQQFTFRKNVHKKQVKHLFEVSCAHLRTTPIWLLVKHIII